jgi:hypothetical protein
MHYFTFLNYFRQGIHLDGARSILPNLSKFKGKKWLLHAGDSLTTPTHTHTHTYIYIYIYIYKFIYIYQYIYAFSHEFALALALTLVVV